MAKQSPHRPFFKEFRVVRQICREGIDESGILPKARYAMTVCHCLEQLLLWEGCKPPLPQVGRRQSRDEVQEAKFPEATAILQYAIPKKMPSPKNHFLGTSYLCSA